MQVLRDPQVELQSSALSLICDVFDNSPNTVLPFIYQLLDYIEGVLKFSTRVETRRGALVAYHSLLRGFAGSLKQALDKKVLKRIRTQLAYIAATDPDPLSRAHANDALEQYKASLFP